MWVPALIATGAGAARLGWAAHVTSIVLLVAAALYAATRLVPARFPYIRSFAGGPAALVVGSAFVVEVIEQIVGRGLTPYSFSAFLLGLAAVISATTIVVSPRVGAGVALVSAAAMVALREYIGATPWDTAWIDTAVLAVAGLGSCRCLYGQATQPAVCRGTGTHPRVCGDGSFGRLRRDGPSWVWRSLPIAHGVETVRAETRRSSFFGRLATQSDDSLLYVPVVMTLVVMAPLAVLSVVRCRSSSMKHHALGRLLPGSPGSTCWSQSPSAPGSEGSQPRSHTQRLSPPSQPAFRQSPRRRSPPCQPPC